MILKDQNDEQFTLFLGASFAALKIEVADHVVDDTFTPLKRDNDRVMFVPPL